MSENGKEKKKRNYTIEKNEGSIMTLTKDFGVIWFKEDGKVYAHKLTESEYHMSNKRLFEMAENGSIEIPEHVEMMG